MQLLRTVQSAQANSATLASILFTEVASWLNASRTLAGIEPPGNMFPPLGKIPTSTMLALKTISIYINSVHVPVY
ncbi:hypothetical protein DPMN_017653 [Dreissena polymorpha]|uniref:Uncharacterized protein n=1 Tax=Dreissena polymorpha TaxID=45954 RepID=A0A9D4S6K6_DREPO|nr:hypothetical protein DPMN_017653 [Dreissena polymorpha]